MQLLATETLKAMGFIQLGHFCGDGMVPQLYRWDPEPCLFILPSLACGS